MSNKLRLNRLRREFSAYGRKVHVAAAVTSTGWRLISRPMSFREWTRNGHHFGDLYLIDGRLKPSIFGKIPDGLKVIAD